MKKSFLLLSLFLLAYCFGLSAQRAGKGKTTKQTTQQRRPSMLDSMQMLEEVVVKGVATKVTLKEDTFEYNASAYKVPEGSTIEELVRRLPGAQISDDGKITINGKEVKKIMVDGKEFMTGDTQTALKNLPTSIVNKVKAYDEKSDMAKMTGVDDGEEETVLDFGVKPGMNRGTMANIDLGIGTESRYAERVMGAYMKDNSRLMLFGSANNTGDRGFISGGRGGWGAPSGLLATKMLGINYNYEKKNKLKLDLSARWNHSDTDNGSTNAMQDFVSTAAAFSNSASHTFSRSNSWNINGRIEWRPDTLTRIMIRPSFTGSSSDSQGSTAKATFSDDPYLYAEGHDPLDSIYMDLANQQMGGTLLVNRTDNRSLSYSTQSRVNINTTVSRQLSRTGRNLTMQVRFSSSHNESESLSNQYGQLFLRDSVYYKNRYNTTPTDNTTWRFAATYSEPLAKTTFLQLRYQYQYNNKTSDRRTHDFSTFPLFAAGYPLDYRTFGDVLAPYLEGGTTLDDYLDTNQSRYSEYDNYVHEIELGIKHTTNKLNLNVGLMLQPQTSNLHYRHLGVDTITSRSVSNFTPTLDFRYRFNKRKNLRLTYRGTTDQPSMTDLLPIRDDSDPLNITEGNPGLKPSFSNSFRLQYNNYVQSHFKSIMAFVNYQNTRNSVSNRVQYDPTTGGRTSRPENINGNWNINGAAMFNCSIDSAGIWNLSTFTMANYSNNVGYVYLPETKTTDKNYTRSTMLMERASIGYRNDWLEVELNGMVNYSINRNKLQPQASLDTWQYQYGTDITANAPWGMSLSTGAQMMSRRGYADASMNTNEFVWNAQLSQSLLRGKPLTLSIQWNDILRNRSSFSRSITASRRSDQWTNAINSYLMFHAIYRFNAFGGKGAKGGPGMGGPMGGPGMGGPRGGGFGGRRGPRF